MTSSIISARNLGKKYRIGSQQVGYKRLTESIMDMIATPIRNIRQLGKPVPEDEVFWALRDINFDIYKGDVVGVIGENGSGKSTLLKLISQITTMTEGEIAITGRVGSLLEVGTGFHPELTGRENIYLNGTILGMSRHEINRKFDEIIDFAEIEQFLDTPVKRYSSGMYIRLAFAIAAHLETEILIVDEVLAVGDARFQKKSLGKMGNLANEGRTVIFVTHNMQMIKSLCTRSILLNKGRLVYDGDVETGIQKYLTTEDYLKKDGLIADEVQRIGNREALLRQVQILTEDDTPIKILSLNRQINILLTYEVQAHIKEAIVEIGITTSDGSRILTFFSHSGGLPELRLTQGSVKFKIKWISNLLPGDYFMDVAIHDMSRNGLTLDWVERAIALRVENIAEDDGHGYPARSVRGFILPPSSWTIIDNGEV